MRVGETVEVKREFEKTFKNGTAVLKCADIMITPPPPTHTDHPLPPTHTVQFGQIMQTTVPNSTLELEP